MKKTLIISIVALFILQSTCVAQNAMAQSSFSPIQRDVFVITVPVASYSLSQGELYEDLNGNPQNELSIGLGFYELGIHYFFTRGFAAGGLASYNSENQGDYRESTLTLGPTISYYHELTTLLYPYVTAGFTYTSIETENIAPEENTNYTGTSYLIKGGMNYMVREGIGIYAEGIYNFNTGKTDTEDQVSGSKIGFALGAKAFFH